MEESENVFRSKYRELSKEEKELMDELKNKAQELYNLIDKTQGRHSAIAKTELELCVMCAVKQITS